MSDKEALDKAYEAIFKSIFENYVLDQDYEKLSRGLNHLKQSYKSVLRIIGMK